jgi:hypothetical protein
LLRRKPAWDGFAVVSWPAGPKETGRTALASDAARVEDILKDGFTVIRAPWVHPTAIHLVGRFYRSPT